MSYFQYWFLLAVITLLAGEAHPAANRPWGTYALALVFFLASLYSIPSEVLR